MAAFKQYIDARKGTVTRLVDTTLQIARERGGLLQQYMPQRNYSDWRLAWLNAKWAPQIASFVSKGGEIPKVRREGRMKEYEAEYIKVALSQIWDEEQQQQLAELQAAAQLSNDVKRDLARYIFQSLEDLVFGINDAANLIGWQIIFGGATSYVDPRTEVPVQYSYDVDPSLQFTNAAGPTEWINSATANGLNDLVTAAEAFRAVNGYFPNETVMSRVMLNQLLAQESTKEAAVARQFGDISAAPAFEVRRQALAELIVDREIPPIVLFDELYTDQDDNRVRFTPEDTFAFLTSTGVTDQFARPREVQDNNNERAMGELAFGPLVSNNNRPGIYTLTKEVSEEPPIDKILASANVAPVLYNPSLISTYKVNA